MNNSKYKEYCTGCGLCKSVLNVRFEEDEKGYSYPCLVNKDENFFKSVCPVGGAASHIYFGKNIWGRYKNVYLGWSTNDKIREQASSGGILTGLCCYLLEKKIVDAVIQIKASDTIAYATEVAISRSPEDVLKCMGSRYSISSPLENIKQYVEENKEYAFVGKPCDVSALRMYMQQDNCLKKCIKYMFSFFCAGEPSRQAQMKLLNRLGCKNAEECVKLQYRGNGWPGYTVAMKADGTTQKMEYSDSWGDILGRDIRKICRFCFDGIGETADIACGDAWHLDDNKMPDFTESQGRNVVFGRTEKGAELLENAKKDGYIYLEDYSERVWELRYIQRYQFDRRAGMKDMLNALKISGKVGPQYNKKLLNTLDGYLPLKTRIRRFFGVLKRVKAGKI